MSDRRQHRKTLDETPASQQTITQMSREKVINWRPNVHLGHTTHQLTALDVSFNTMLTTENDQLINFCIICNLGTNIYDISTYKDGRRGAGI